MAQIVIANITAYDPSLPGERTLYFSTQAYVSSSSESPADTFYDPRIEQPANISRQCFSAGTTFGATTVGYGDLVLINNDGGLDYLLDYSFGGRTIEIKVGTINASDSVPTWSTLISGTMEQAEFSWNQVTIKVRDKQQELTTPLQTTTYLGNNVLPAGIEGVATDLKGKRKPLVFGTVKYVTPPCVNTSKLIYQISADALTSVGAVYDRGVPLTAGATYSSQADMEATAPSAGQYRVWLAGGCFRLGSTPTGTVTADATAGAAAANRTAAQIMKSILLKAGIPLGSINSTDVTNLDSLVSYEMGIYIGHDEDTSSAAALDEIANSVGAWWGVDRTGVFRFGRIVLPSGSPVAILDSVNILSINRTNTSDSNAGVPSWKVNLNYLKVYSPTDDLAGSVTAAEKARLAEEFRKVTVTDSSVKTAHKYSPELSFDTLLLTESDATAEANRRLTIYKQRRDMLQVQVYIEPNLISSIDLGQVVQVELPRYGMTSGKLFLIVGIRTDMRNNIFDLTLWG